MISSRNFLVTVLVIWWCAFVLSPRTVAPVDPPLGFPPASGAPLPPGLGSLPSAVASSPSGRWPWGVSYSCPSESVPMGLMPVSTAPVVRLSFSGIGSGALQSLRQRYQCPFSCFKWAS